jgi:hypothetical protein
MKIVSGARPACHHPIDIPPIGSSHPAGKPAAAVFYSSDELLLFAIDFVKE